MAEKSYKCAFKHCKHSSREISRDNAIAVGKRYMHKDCAITNFYISKIKDLYYENVSQTVVIKNLMATINNIVVKKGIQADYLYFALSHAISANIKINSPYGLHYLVDNARIKSLWKKKKADEVRKDIQTVTASAKTLLINKFNYSENNTNGFSGILRGDN